VIVAAGEALFDCFLGAKPELRPGGAPYNWARWLGRLGVAAAFTGVLSEDALGSRLLEGLGADGVRFLGRRSKKNTPLALVGDEGFRFYAEGTTLLDPVSLPRARAYLLGSLALQLGRVTLPKEGFLALDPNVRPGLTPTAFRRAWPALAARARLIKLSEEDARWLRGDPAALATGGRVVVLTQGPKGAVAYLEGKQLAVPAAPARVLDPTGAGDSFFAALVAELDKAGALAAWPPEEPQLIRALKQAERLAAQVVGRRGAL
jgi:fructokinase